MPTIILSVDDSPSCADAVELTRTIATALRARVIVSGVYPAHTPLGAGGAALVRVTHADAVKAVSHAAQALEADLRVEERVLSADSAAQALSDLAAEEAADLIVLGARPNAHDGRTTPGRLALQLLHSAPCAIAVAPAGYAKMPHKLERVGVGHDSGFEADAAVAFALRLARSCGADLDICHVAEHSAVTAAGMWALGHITTREWAERDIDDVLKRLPDDVNARGTVLDGEVVRALIEQSANVDLLVLGSRGYGPIGRVLIGSVAVHVLRLARCPVIVVPRAVRQRIAVESAPVRVAS